MRSEATDMIEQHPKDQMPPQYYKKLLGLQGSEPPSARLAFFTLMRLENSKEGH